MNDRALLGYDEVSEKEDFEIYFHEHIKIHDKQKAFEYILGYAKKYPRNYKIAKDLTQAITELPQEKWEEYMPLMRETCEKIVNECTIQWIRENAIRDMCLICPDAELEKWYHMCGAQYEAFQGEVFEKRLWLHGKTEECILRHGINNFYLLCHFLTRSNRDQNDPARGIAWCRKQMKMLEFLGGGEVPEVWLGRYAHCAMELSRLLFMTGETEEGYQWLDTAFERYDRWCAIPDGTMLDTGDPELFGGIKGTKGLYGDHAWDIQLPDGSMEYFQYAHAYILPQNTDLYSMTVHWRGTEKVREEERFQPYIARAKALAGITE